MDSPWWQRGVIYQIYPRSFQDTNSDGIGDLDGIAQRLDYLAWLGVDALWLSPIFPSPMADFGYDIADYTDIAPIFGDLAGFDRLLAAAHQRGLAVLLDFVPNHSSDQHPWFVEARQSRTSHRRDWYVWADPRPDGGPPNNWLSVFGGPAWTFDASTGQYYLHSFLPSMPDLNWRNPAVKAALFDVVRFWLERGVDGIRIDTAHYLMKDAQLRDNPRNPDPRPAFHRPMGDYDRQLHLYDKGDLDIHEVYRELRALLDSYSATQPRVAIGEIHIFDWPVWARYYGIALDELHMPFNFGLLATPWDAAAVRQLVDAIETALPPGAWPNYVLGNHDEARLATRLGPAQARLATMLLLTLRGTPTLYYGDELGMEDAPIPSEQAQDPWGLRVSGMSRDPARTPMPWDASPNSGFCPPAVMPWLPLTPALSAMNVARQAADPRSSLNLARSLLLLRRQSAALSLGRYQALEGMPTGCYGYLREANGQRVLVILNFTAHEQLLALPDAPRTAVLVSTHLDRTGLVAPDGLRLRPAEGLILELEHAQ